ncbi:hypothetical protein GUJ93_ZPchr0013g37048 [Zizania palustris]|uniref:Uncharacterized protein n=1 Tax=Zizania palustris TaxID=103762 RepID=A0A8J5X2M3_ZIZPA|nr:hypothetical protein GUJ93_ZPchr0013g37048 [Zizania palustris]
MCKWDDDDVEVVPADTLAQVALADVSINVVHDKVECLSGRDLSDYDFDCRQGVFTIQKPTFHNGLSDYDAAEEPEYYPEVPPSPFAEQEDAYYEDGLE